MLVTPQTASVAFVLLGVYLYFKYRRSVLFSSPNKAGFPGEERCWPLVGAAPVLFNKRFRNAPLHFQLEREKDAARFGEKEHWPKTVTIPFLGRVIAINNPHYLEYVQKTNFANYPKGEQFRRPLADLLGHTGIFVADGAVWQAQRKIASRIFSVGNFKSHVQTTLHTELEVLTELLDGVASSGEALELQSVFFRFTLASFGMIAFNQDFASLPRRPSELHSPIEFADAFDFAQSVVDIRFRDPSWSIVERFSAKGRRMRKAVKTIKDYAYAVIDDRLAKHEKLSEDEKLSLVQDSKSGRDLLDLYITMGNFDRLALMEIVLNMIIAGRDTTAQALSWMFWELCAQPAVMRRVQEEVDSLLPDGRFLTYEDMSSLPYLQACFAEALRLHPPVARNGKQAAEDDWLPANPALGVPALQVCKGDRLIWSDWVMARMPSIWGPDCDKYKPERFLSEEGRFQRPSPFVFHAFNAGPRLCLGETLATFEGMAVAAFILQRFKVDLMPGYEEEPMYGASVTHPMADPYLVRLHRRQVQKGGKE